MGSRSTARATATGAGAGAGAGAGVGVGVGAGAGAGAGVGTVTGVLLLVGVVDVGLTTGTANMIPAAFDSVVLPFAVTRLGVMGVVGAWGVAVVGAGPLATAMGP